MNTLYPHCPLLERTSNLLTILRHLELCMMLHTFPSNAGHISTSLLALFQNGRVLDFLDYPPACCRRASAGFAFDAFERFGGAGFVGGVVG